MKVSPIYLLINLFILPSFICTGDRESKVFTRAASVLAFKTNEGDFKKYSWLNESNTKKIEDCIIKLESSSIGYSVMQNKEKKQCAGFIGVLSVDKNERGKGYGGALLLKAFFDIYDSCSASGLKKLDVSWEAIPFAGNRMSTPELKSWYSSFGAESDKNSIDIMKIPLNKIDIIKDNLYGNSVFEKTLLKYHLKSQEESAQQKKEIDAAFSLWKRIGFSF